MASLHRTVMLMLCTLGKTRLLGSTSLPTTVTYVPKGDVLAPYTCPALHITVAQIGLL